MSGFHDFSTLLGNNLETKQGQKPTNEVLAGKDVVALYFSAHWCPPCKAFTPKLRAAYDMANEDEKELEAAAAGYGKADTDHSHAESG